MKLVEGVEGAGEVEEKMKDGDKRDRERDSPLATQQGKVESVVHCLLYRHLRGSETRRYTPRKYNVVAVVVRIILFQTKYFA